MRHSGQTALRPFPRHGSNAIATGNRPQSSPFSSLQQILLSGGQNRDGQQMAGNGVVSAPSDALPVESLEAPGEPSEPLDPFTGKGQLLEATDAEAFKAIDEMVRSQEHLAKNRLQIDKHYTATKLGYWGSSLIKVENQDQYKQSYLPGTIGQLRSGAVPNKQADLCNKLTETLLVDPPKLEPEAEDDNEVAQRGAELAREYLQQDATEAGTDDLTLFAAQVEGATTRASTFNHYWVDPTGGGSMPKQVKAHPQATDPANPLDAIDPMTGQSLPTTDYVLRYVTADGQFTPNPSEAERVWLPRIRVDKLGREHVRLFPETADVHHAQQAVVLHYCTVAEARRRWPETLGELADAEWVPICGWSPPRAQVLLPSSLRATWKAGMQNAAQGIRAQSYDQQLVFFYAYYGLAEPGYPEGAALVVNGANGGMVFAKDTLSATVEIPSTVSQDETVTDTKDLDLPLVQLRLLADVDGKDPTGTPFMARIAGAGEAGATMATAMLEAIDNVLHPVRYSMATSPLDADDVEAARATGDYAQVLTRDDVPVLEESRDLPNAYFNMNGWLYDQMDSAAGLRPPDRASEAKVKSGVALRIEVSEATKTLTRMNYALHTAWARHGRIKLQMAMKHFSVPQLLRYVGVDGASKQEWFSGNDFARVGSVRIQTGTGTMLPWSEKVNLALQLQGAGMMDADEASEIARPAFSKQLGATENPHVQRIERQVSSWLEGPPEGWEEQQMAFTQLVQQHAALSQEALQMDPMAQIPPAPEAPWTPFKVEPMDAEPPIAAIRKRRLAKLMAKVEFSAQPEPWQQVVRDAYAQAVKALTPPPQAAPAGAPPPGQPVNAQSIDAGAEAPAGAV